MSRRILIAVACLLSTLLSANAQVENYCLRLAQGGNVDCGAMPELDGKTSYSVQFFINPTTWTEGATVYARGDDFKATLSTSGAILFTVGSTNLKATGDVKAGSWSQVTLTVADGSAKVLINDQVVASGTLGAIPASTESFIIGGGSYAGRIDELRLWQGTLNGDFDYFYNNTLNRWNPQWDMLVAYYKFDQSSCDAVVDYKSIYTRTATNHHGAFSVSGATREKVTDNVRLPYLINAAYTNNSRFYDRSIPREQYLLSNEIIILGINSFSDGHLAFITPNNHGTVTNGTYLSDYKGRKGVLSLAGAGSDMACTTNCLTPAINSSGVASTGYTFETWIYLEKWTEGAYIFRKETADGQHGFSIRLGADSTKQVIVRCNGKNFVNVNSMKVGEWLYFGVSPFQGDTPRQTFLFSYNGVGKFAVSSLSDNSIDYTPTGMDTCVAHIGENLNAKLDNTCVWDQKFGADGISGHYSYGIPMPALGKTVAADIMNNSNSYYTYDDPDNVGFSSHSQDEWRRIMQSAYEGYYGYHTVISVQSHSGWLTTIANAAKRKIFAADLARLSDGYDGVELDLEWADTQSAWNTYGLLADEIKAVLPAGKTFRISCHAYGAYLFPIAKMGEVDGFTFQQYGPSNTYFTWSNFTSSYANFVKWGFDKKKIMLSYSTTTSGPYDASGNRTGTAITGVRNGLLDAANYQLSDDMQRGLLNGYYYYFVGPKQTYRRAKYCQDNNLQGIFYWDMGNDVPVQHKYNTAKWCSYGLNANIDTLVTHVTLNHPTSIGSVVYGKSASGELNVSFDPSSNRLSIRLNNDKTIEGVTLYSPSGACVFKCACKGEHSVDVSQVPSGLYVVSVAVSGGLPMKGKLIIKR